MKNISNGKKSIHVFSAADMSKGHGVLSAYEEQVGLIKKKIGNEYNISVNPPRLGDINHYHTINFSYYLRNNIFGKKSISVGYVHFLPETLDKSIRLPKLIRKIFYKYIIRFYKSMDYTVVVNPYFIEEMKKYGIDTSRTTYIPNLVSNEHFSKLSDEEKAEKRKEYGIKPDQFLVLGVGQLQTRKGIFDFTDIAKELPDMQFLWAGGFSFGNMQEGYHEIKELQNNPPENMKFLGMVDRLQMNDLYNIADVMFLPSYAELFPMTILEAMATNTPILLRDIDIYKLILDGYYLKAGDNKGFIEELKKLRDDPEYRKKAMEMSKRGNDFYSEESIGEMWKEYYDSLE
ncbi:MAG: glycosyltransferase family 4 protein [Tissierellia bacterium]|nr:glycosyltransferase family 4 protein [Tissierellia bacterium]